MMDAGMKHPQQLHMQLLGMMNKTTDALQLDESSCSASNMLIDCCIQQSLEDNQQTQVLLSLVFRR
jgi:hypothetical protein